MSESVCQRARAATSGLCNNFSAVAFAIIYAAFVIADAIRGEDTDA